MARYYHFEYGDPKGWHLAIKDFFADGTPVDIWAYRGGRLLENPETVPFAIQVDGSRVDYYRGAFCTVVVSKRLADLWQSICPSDIQRIPANVDGDTGEWEVVVVVPVIDCIDHQRSVIQYYPPNHPEKANQPRSVFQLVLDASRIGDHDLFHPKGWEVATVVSERVKNAMQAMGATGTEYWPVGV
jgi:hypothetical protein